jgi:plastocyanin
MSRGRAFQARRMAFSITLLLGTVPLSTSWAEPVAGAYTIFMTVAEVKGSTTTDKLEPPAIDPADLSKGYGFRGPADPHGKTPQRSEVSSYLFLPGYATVRQGDTVTLNMFVVNGDEHEIRLVAPDGRPVAGTTRMQRGREYRLSFTATHTGPYQLVCSTHAPTMTATLFVVPR